MKRFYKDVSVGEAQGGWQVSLDGRPVKTQGGIPQIVPSSALAHALAGEWGEQGDEIDPKRFLFRDHADFAIDIVGADRAAAIAKLIGYAETDTLCYRADPEDALYARQQDVWDPLVQHLEGKLGLRFRRVSGIVHRAQPEDTLSTLRQHLEAQDDFTLAGMTAMASLAASLCVALLANDAAINDPMLLWRDANLEEEWQAEKWGRDEEAEAVRKRREDDFSNAQAFTALAVMGR
ncbi:ATP12 family chaperone protein [Qipengyuania qiaonensis]|uniref:Molecular chaperone n=1 Tax=Qipengyuania qiaonensis TaxID=2867240 RepID=A0ABS7J7B8_9SPHN|nr:molecular chaperone [Qipengyuania qiaonensis]